MRATDLDPARKLSGPVCEETNSRNSRLELTETSSPSCVSVRRHLFYFRPFFITFEGTLAQNLESDYTKSTPQKTEDAVRGVASPDTCVYYQAGVREGTYVRVRGRVDGVSRLKQGGWGNS